MDADLSRRSHEVFSRALDVAERERAGFIEVACGGDARLRTAVERLIRAIEDSATFLEAPALSGGVRGVGDGGPRRAVIGGYRVVRVIGVGGMATVYEAVGESPKRRVALKVMRHGLSRSSALARFRFETEVLARLQHPGIAQMYEVGAIDEGDGLHTPFFAMELVEGALPITAHADRRGMSRPERLEMFARVCDAVHHGHQVGIIHRDLKPGNILVGSDGRPRVIDFGVARSTDPGQTRITHMADLGQLVGTLSSMSPEQCAGDAMSLDIRTDVYSLGVVLYELVCAVAPHDLSSVPITEALRVVQHESPRRPSSIDPTLRGDIEAIILKAIEKERERRYPTASEFAADIRRYLADQPVMARPATTLYQLRKFARRNRPLVAGAAAVALSLIAGIAATSRMAYVATAARRDADLRAAELERVAAFQDAQLSSIDIRAMGELLRAELEGQVPGDVSYIDVARTTLDQTLLDPTTRAIREQFADTPAVASLLHQSVARTAASLGLFDRALVAQREALTLRRDWHGEAHPDTLESLDTLGSALARAGKTVEAESAHRSAYEGRRDVLGPEHPATLASLNNLCSDLQALGRFDEAEPLLRETYAARQRVLGPEHPDTIATQHSLANLMRSQGKLAEAEAAYRAVLDVSRRVRGTSDTETLRITNNLASLWMTTGNLEESEALQRELLDIRRRTLGVDHPETLHSMSALASIVRETGRLVEAEALFVDTLERRRRVLGETHSSTLHTLAGYASILRQQGKVEQSIPQYQAALDGRRRSLGDDHMETLQSIHNMSGLMHELKRYGEAEALSREVIERCERVMPKGHWYLGVFRGHLGDILADTGRFAEAEAHLLEARSVFLATFGDDHSRTIGATRALAEFYHAWHEAEPDPIRLEHAATWRALAPAAETDAEPR